MSVLSRVSAPAATHDLAGVVVALFSNPERAAPRNLPGSAGAQLTGDETQLAASLVGRLVTGPTGLGTSAARILLVSAEPSADSESRSELYGQVGIYPGALDRVRSANFGRLMMLTHPATDDSDRLLTASKCILAEWATDDHFLDEESMGANAKVIGSRLGITYATVDPVDLPVHYAPQLDQALSEEPVAVAYRSAFEHFARYATATQVARLRHELAVMFMAYNHEANWRATGRIPPVWEYLTHRHENSFLPPMVLVDPIAGYELPAFEFADRRVRRVFCLVGTASVIVNDVYSMGKKADEDFDLPKVIAARARRERFLHRHRYQPPHARPNKQKEVHDDHDHPCHRHCTSHGLSKIRCSVLEQQSAGSGQPAAR